MNPASEELYAVDQLRMHGLLDARWREVEDLRQQYLERGIDAPMARYLAMEAIARSIVSVAGEARHVTLADVERVKKEQRHG